MGRGGIMTKKEFANAVVAKAGVQSKDVQKIIDAVYGVVVDELKEGRKVTLTGIGTLEVVDKPAREGRNVRTGEKIQIAASKAPKFKASKTLKDVLNA